MANHFSISVAPELAGLETKINTVNDVVDAIRAVDVPALVGEIDDNEALIDAVGIVATNIRTVDVPALVGEIDDNEAKIDTNKAVMDAIRGTDVPNIQAVVDAIRATDITTITDAIAAKIFRGQLKYAYKTHNTGTYATALNISGKTGVVLAIVGETGVGSPMKMQITADGLASLDCQILAEQNQFYVPNTTVSSSLHLGASDTPCLLNIEFKDTMLIQVKMTAGAIGVKCGIYYIED